jgi:SAM-dependent methyltransferase
MAQAARYDGLADWYRAWSSARDRPIFAETARLVEELLGRGRGRCLDVGCGGGRMIPTLARLGWRVTGLDASADQLRVAEEEAGGLAEALVLGDAAALPFPAGSFDACLMTFLHTDVDDPAPVFAEAARVLRPGGCLLHVGSHPCFKSPFAQELPGGIVLHPGYRDTGWRTEGPGLGDGIRRRAGVRHVPLDELLSAFARSGLRLERAREAHGADYPGLLALLGLR